MRTETAEKTCHVRMAKNVACRLAASLRVVCNRKIESVNCQKVLAHFWQGACARTGRAHADWGKYLAF